MAGTACWRGSRSLRVASRSNHTVASGGTEQTSASTVVRGDQRSTRAATQGDDDVGDEDPAVDRPEDLHAQLGGLQDVLHVHAGEQADPGQGLGDGDDAEGGGGGAGSHAPILPDGSAQVGPAAG